MTGKAGTAAPFVIRNAEVRVRIDGVVQTSAGRTCHAEGDQPLVCALNDGLLLALRSVAEEGGLLLTASVTGPGDHKVDGFELLATRAADAALIPSGAPAALHYLHNGYQSWSFSGALEVPDGTPLERKGGVVAYAAPNGSVAGDEKVGLSSHGAVIDGGDGTALVLGFVTAQRWQGAIGLEAANGHFLVTVQNGFTGDAVPLAGEADSESLFVKYEASAISAMTDYGSAIARRQATRPQPAPDGQRGWFSWNRYFDRIDEPTVQTQSAALKSFAGSNGFDLLEVDDGWENGWGDWQPNLKFHAIEEVAAEIHGRGQRLGLWVAPFVVEESLAVVTEHPDWWVRRADGTPIVHTLAGSPHRLRVVDLTHPDALAWAVANLTTLHAAGADFFKLDYLYAGAFDGLRHDPTATGVTALTRGLQAIFAGIGTSGLNLCGVPWLHGELAAPSTMRTGTDVAFQAVGYGFVLVAAGARNLAARSYGPLSLRADPDQFWLQPLKPEEVRTAVTWQALSGASFALADDLAALSSDQAATLRSAVQLPVSSNSMAPRGLFDDVGTELLGTPVVEVISSPSSVQSHLPAVMTRGDLLAVTNWGDTPRSLDLHLAAGESVTAVWGPEATAGHVTLTSHDTALYRLKTK